MSPIEPPAGDTPNLVSQQIVAQVTTVHSATDPRILAKIARTSHGAGYRTLLIHPGTETDVLDGVELVGLRLRGGRLVRMLLGGWRALVTGLRSGAHVLHFHDPELLPIGILWRLSGRKVVYDVHEDLPRDILTKAWIPAALRPAVAAIAAVCEAIASRMVSAVIAATPVIGSRFPAKKTVVIRNYPEDLPRFAEGGRPWKERRAEVIYVGGLTVERGLLTMLQAIELVEPALGARLVLAGPIIGPESERLRSLVSQHPKVEYLGQITRTEVIRRYGESRVGLVCLHPLPQFMDALPIKMFEYMASGLPVIASNFGLWNDIVLGNEAGLSVDPQDASSIARAIERLLRDDELALRLGAGGQRAVLTSYSWEGEARRLTALYARLLERTS